METDYVFKGESECKAAVLGHPISHSLSPALHRVVFEEFGLRCSYSAIDVTEDQLPQFLEGLDSTWVGLSLTMPLKVKVLELVGNHDELVTLTQSANTVYRVPSGDFALTNTDVFGMQNALLESGLHMVDRVLIIGSGATARSAVIAVRNLGAQLIRVQARNSNSRQEIVDLINSVGAQSSSGDIDLSESSEFDLVVSTLPQGAIPAQGVSVGENTGAMLMDVSYSPWPSMLARSWPNDQIVSGKEMLLWQATRQVELFYGVSAPVDLMRMALEGS